MLAAHPYEEPAYDVVELADAGEPRRAGTAGSAAGRADDAARVRRRAWRPRCPATAHGVRVAGDPDRPVRRVAVGGGAGDFLLDRCWRTDADVYLTSDLRHHRAAEFLEHGGPALVDVAHWAAEWTWLPVAARRRLRARRWGDTVETRVSTTSPTRGPSAADRPPTAT